MLYKQSSSEFRNFRNLAQPSLNSDSEFTFIFFFFLFGGNIGLQHGL